MKRIIVGNRGGVDYAMWISKPGKDAASTSDDDMLVSPSRFLVQPYMQGQIYAAPNGQGNGALSNSKVSTVVAHNLGFVPVVEVFGTYAGGQVQLISTVSTTQLQFNNANDNTIGSTIYAINIVYIIFRTLLSAS